MATTSTILPALIPPDAYAIDAPNSRRQFSGSSQYNEMAIPSSSSPPAGRSSSSRQRSNSGRQASAPLTPQQPQQSPNYSSASSGGTARPLPNTTTSPRSPSYTTAPDSGPLANSYGQSRHQQQQEQGRQQPPSAQIPPRASSRSQSVALAPEASLADRTRARGDSHGSQQYNNASSSSSRAQASAVSPNARSSSRRDGQTQPISDSQLLAAPASSHGPSGSDMSRENSEVISRVVVDDPSSDIAREQARVVEATPDGHPVPRSASMPPASRTPAAAAASSTTAEDASKPQQQQQQQQKRQDFSSSAAAASKSGRKEARLGEYILGQTLGEGEFGKVKLGWKKDGSVQVAVKMIRRENLTTNPSRLPKIYREIHILGQLSHPNIVKLHEMVETERYIGIVLEYASGGELFDYILTHRYLKDGAARRLFAQLVSGVGYLHKKGIVHRDLKLENLLLDRNRNLMITDFGFANTFRPHDELGDEAEARLTDRDFVRRMDLERVRDGFRRGDLMQTSCGSPCYAAPELVVTDSLYTGRKVDVWSCGVILYAMLAGYLPFDDDPANPEGDNINLLYKYIVSTPLTFPEYVSPTARDLLRRILVPDPRKRADLFEVARHSWLSEYTHVVGHITSTSTTIEDITGAPGGAGSATAANGVVNGSRSSNAGPGDTAPLARSASVREPIKGSAGARSPAAMAGPSSKGDRELSKGGSPSDSKRRTVQVEYVAPRTQTNRGEPAAGADTAGASGSAARQSSQQATSPATRAAAQRKPLPAEPRPSAAASQPVSPHAIESPHYRPAPSGMAPPPPRPARDLPPRSSGSDHPNANAFAGSIGSIARPNTGGSLASSGGGAGRLPSRGNSYSQPLAPTVAATTAPGRIAQPKSRQPAAGAGHGAAGYKISHPIPLPEPFVPDEVLRPSSQRMPSARRTGELVPSGAGVGAGAGAGAGKGHKRSTTLGSVFARTGSFFGGRPSTGTSTGAGAGTGTESPRPEKEKRYPPTSMRVPIAAQEAPGSSPRLSSDSRRPSFGFSRKNSGSSMGKQESQSSGGKDGRRRFSLLPAGFSLKNFGGGGAAKPGYGAGAGTESTESMDQKTGLGPAAAPPRTVPTPGSYAAEAGNAPYMHQQRGPVPGGNPYRDDYDGADNEGGDDYDALRTPTQARQDRTQAPARGQGYGQGYAQTPDRDQYGPGAAAYRRSESMKPFGAGNATSAATAAAGIPHSASYAHPPSGLHQSYTAAPHSSQTAYAQTQRYPAGFNDEDGDEQPRPSVAAPGAGKGRVLQKSNRRFAEGYEDGRGDHAGSTSAARRVMDFFRRRGRSRAGEDR